MTYITLLHTYLTYSDLDLLYFAAFVGLGWFGFGMRSEIGWGLGSEYEGKPIRTQVQQVMCLSSWEKQYFVQYICR